MPAPDRRAERRRMVRRDLRQRDITDRRVLATLASVPRERFVPADLCAEAYADRPLPIGYGQTISQPYIVALMTQAAGLTRHSRVLEVGGGSGYHAAVLGRLAGQVWSVERVPELAAAARHRLRALGVGNVHVLVGDGRHGYPAAAPFHAILVAAATADPPPALLQQLAPGGRLVIPLGPPDVQDLVVWERTASGTTRRVLCPCCFVPLVAAP
ncbi:MAG TPA: protein-L-isoaspartate(D-aspartate) O-methyltransferase [Gemmatimonadales bacterium]